jgi:hypothetical protein
VLGFEFGEGVADRQQLVGVADGGLGRRDRLRVGGVGGGVLGGRPRRRRRSRR